MLIEVQGDRVKKIYFGLKSLNTKEASYHGGALNRVDASKILTNTLECESYKDNVLLECIRDDEERCAAYHEMFTILGRCRNILRHPPRAGDGTLMDDDELDEAIKSCQAWAERLPVLFPDKNLTRKGHSLSVHIPETLRSCRTYYMFYKAEQTGEAVHAAFNRLFQRYASRRPKTERLWGMMSDYEASLGFVTDITVMKKRKKVSEI